MVAGEGDGCGGRETVVLGEAGGSGEAVGEEKEKQM